MIESLISENPMFEDEYKVIGNPQQSKQFHVAVDNSRE
jgi:hypothetical protein